MSSERQCKYFAFISYKREDEEWAIWLQHEMEYYHLPVSLNGRDDLPKEFRPVFRDVDDLKAGNLPQQIYEALSDSASLIVICSPKSAQSEWVNKEIADFIEIGKKKGIDNVARIFPFIVEGKPRSKDASVECFPKQLLDLPSMDERIGGNVNESGRDKAFIKVMAGMLPNVAMDELWDRYEHDKAEEERLKREERERFLRMQSRFIAEKVNDLNDDSALAQLLAVEVLPNDLSHPDRPYVIEAERALRRASFRHKITLRGHTQVINDIAFSSDGEKLATISDDFSIRIWDVKTGSLINIIDCGHPFGKCITFSPDNKNVVAIFGDGALAAWNALTGERAWIFDAQELFSTKHIASASSITHSPDGNQLALSTLEGDIFVMDFAEETTSSVELDDPVRLVSYSPNGQYMIATTDKGFVLWDLWNDQNLNKNVDDRIADLLQNTQAVFSADGQRMAFLGAAPNRCQIEIWELPSLRHIQTIDWKAEYDNETGESSGSIVSIAFCDEGNSLITILDNGIMYLWDIATKESFNGAVLCSLDIQSARFDSTGEYAGLITKDYTAVLVQLRSPYISRIAIDKSPLVTAALSPDGTRLLTSTGLPHEDGFIAQWDIRTGRLSKRFAAHADQIESIAYSNDGARLATASADGRLYVWDALTGEQIMAMESKSVADGEYAFSASAFSPDDNVLATAIQNGSIVLWNAKDGKVLSTIKRTYGGPLFDIAFSPDGTQIALASLDRCVKVWNVQDGSLVREYNGETSYIQSVAFSPDGSQIVAMGQDKTIICWNVSDASIRWKNNVRERGNTVSYSPDGRYIVATIADVITPVIVFEAASGEVVVVLNGMLSEPTFAQFTPDGKQIISTCRGGAIYWWKFPDMEELIAQVAQGLASRQLTEKEKKQFYME